MVKVWLLKACPEQLSPSLFLLLSNFGTLRLSRLCKEGIWRVSRRYLEGVWRVCGGCQVGVWRVSVRCLVVIRIVSRGNL